MGSRATLSVDDDRTRLFVDTNRAGQRWSFRIVQEGDLLAAGQRTTNRFGNFTVTVRDGDDDDRTTAQARNLRTGETCRVTVDDD